MPPDIVRALFVNPCIEQDLEFFHLGTIAVASAVAATGRHQAEYVDFSFCWDTWRDHLARRIAAMQPDLVGISTFSPRMPHARRVAEAVRALRPAAIIAMGGHHATLDTHRLVRQPWVDLAVVGEADLTIVQLLDALESGEDLRTVPSLAWAEGDRVVETGLAPLPSPARLDALPFHDWTLWQQHPRAIWHCGFLPMIGVRGCPYRCAFCSSPAVADRLAGCGPFVRAGDPRRTAQHCAWQWERHHRHGLRHLMFYDQNFLLSQPWLEAFCDEYRALGMHERLPFSAYSRVDHITADKLDLVRSAGCYQLRLGIEAADPRIRNDLLGKRLDDALLRERIAMVHDAGIGTLGYFLMGLPGERPAQAAASFKLARELRLDRAVFLMFTPLAGMRIGGEAIGDGIDFATRHRATSFTDDGLTTEVSDIGRARLRALFYRANGHYLARGFLRNTRRRPWRFLSSLPGYLAVAHADGFTPVQAITQYIYHHDEAWRTA